MNLRGAAVGVVAALIVATNACSAHPERDQYSYDTIQDDDLAHSKYLMDQGYLVDSEALAAQGAELQTWVGLQTQQICDQLASGTSLNELVRFFARTFGDVVTDARRFVGNAAGFSCSGYLG